MERFFTRIKDAVIAGDIDAAKQAAEDALGAGADPLATLNFGINAGLRAVGERFEKGEYFISDMVMSAEAAKAALSVLTPGLDTENAEFLGRIVIGSVEGDIHDLGKSIVTTMLGAAGFDVVDLGVDAPAEQFVNTVRSQNPQIVAASAYMSTTLQGLKDVSKALESEALRGKVKYMIGGAAVFPEHVKEVGADTYGRDAIEAVKEAKKMVGVS